MSTGLRTHRAHGRLTTSVPVESRRNNPQTAFAFVVRNYDNNESDKILSSWHHFGGLKWRLMIFPRGNTESNGNVSLYLECGGPSKRQKVPAECMPYIDWTGRGPWSCLAKLSLHVVHPSSPVAKAGMGEGTSSNGVFEVDLSGVGFRSYARTSGDIVRESTHTFRNYTRDWGFLEFAPIGDLVPMNYADEEGNLTFMARVRLQ